jgi:hypothetical protein
MRNRLRTKAARFYPAPFLEVDRAIAHEARLDAKDMLVKIARERIEYCRKGLRDANGARRLQTQIDSMLRDAPRLIASRAGSGASLAWSDRRYGYANGNDWPVQATDSGALDART